MDILCSDKTGTLTLNKLSVDANTVFPMSGHSVEDVLKFAALSAQRDSDEAIDKVGCCKRIPRPACPQASASWQPTWLHSHLHAPLLRLG